MFCQNHPDRFTFRPSDPTVKVCRPCQWATPSGRFAIVSITEDGTIYTYARTDGGGYDFHSAVTEVVASYEWAIEAGDAAEFQIVQIQ